MILTNPILGVFVSQQQIRNMNNQKPNTNTLALIKANQIAQVLLYFFCISDINVETKKIKGTYYDESNNLWTNRLFPYPNVLYIRGGSTNNLGEKWEHFRGQLQESEVKLLNSVPAFNKWEVIKVLQKYEKTAPYLPSTILYIKEDDLKDWLARYKKVYVKACKGSKGRQVMCVKQLKQNLFQFTYFRNGKLKKGKLKFKTLIEKVLDFFCKKPFIIQEAIDLPLIDNSICDMRAEVQRNGEGKLEVTEILVRISRPGAPVTQHASSYVFSEFFSKYTNYSLKEIQAKKIFIETFLVNIYKAIESAYGPFGEIGIDFAFDKNNHIWFLETNSQPAKVSLVKASDDKTIEKVFLNPLEYAKFLSK